MNRTDCFVLKSFAAPRSPTMHPKLGKSGLHGPRGSPLSCPLPDLRDSPLRGLAVPLPGPSRRFSSRGRSGGFGTGPCFSLKNLYRARRSGGLICPAAPRATVPRRRHREATPHAPRLPGAGGQLLITAARSAPPRTTASAGHDFRACAVRPGTPSRSGGSACPPVRRRHGARWSGRGKGAGRVGCVPRHRQAGSPFLEPFRSPAPL